MWGLGVGVRPLDFARDERIWAGGGWWNRGRLRTVCRETKKEKKMATRTRSQSTSNGNSSGGESGRSSFAWPGNQTGMIAAAVVAGAAVGLAANLGRKMVVQGLGASAGDWADMLAAEHKAVLALFDKLEATEDSQTW